MVEAAKEGRNNAFTSDNSGFDARFGASVLTKLGNIYSAGQYYSDTLSLTLHAEQAALAHAAAHGEYAIEAVAIIGNQQAYQMSGGKIYPCHLCKQLLWESHLRSGINTELFILDVSGDLVESVSLLDIMFLPWPITKSK
jgi:cytidine deaminase